MQIANDLSARAMLANLSISVWGARRLDRKVTKEATEANDATADAGRFNKLLVPPDALRGVQSALSAARIEHYRRTLPWKDEGARILTADGYLAYSEAMRKLRVAFDGEVEAFCFAYPKYLETAPQRLGKMYTESEFPEVAHIRTQFDFDIDISPLPTSGDFRVALSKDQAEAIRADIEARSADSLRSSMRDVGRRVNEVVGHMAERLRSYTPGTETTRATGTFKDSLVENVRELVAVLPSLDITGGDAGLADLATEIDRLLCRIGPDTLRANDSARAKVAESAESILAKVNSYFG